MHEEIKNALNSGNPAAILSSRWLSKTINIKAHRTILLPDVLHGSETSSAILTDGYRLQGFQKRDAGQDIWVQEGGINGRLDKTA
jgi:hypothetical protein